MRFPFQRFQNTMRAVGHFSLFIMAKILRKQYKKPHQYNNENFMIFENPCGANCHIMKFCGTYKKHAGGNGNLIINFAWPKLIIHDQTSIWGQLIDHSLPETCAPYEP